MTRPAITRFARAFWVVIVALTVATVILLIRDGSRYPGNDAADSLAFPALLAPVYATVGALIVSRRGNAIGWLFCVMAAGLALFPFGTAYAFHSLAIAPEPLPATTLAAWLTGWTALPALAPVILVFLLFPDGRPPSRRWRPVQWFTVASVALMGLGVIFNPGDVSGPWSEGGSVVRNPVGIEYLEAIPGIGSFGIFVSSVLCALAIIVRYRRSRGEERQQLRWMAFVPAVTLASVAITIIASIAVNILGEVGASDSLGNLLWSVLPLFIFLGVPIAAGISILRYHLYDLDIVIKKTVVFGVLAASLTVVYLVIAVGIPTLLFGVGSNGSSGLNIPYLIAALIVAIAFQPLRTQARKLADRLVYGKRASPYEVLSEFSERMSETYSTDDVLPRMAQIVASSTGATVARVWLRIGPDLRVEAAWPEDADRPAPIRLAAGAGLPEFPAGESCFPVLHRGELLGALTATVPASDPFTPSQEKLLLDLASQAGLMLRNVRLIEELRASRQRLVAAQDEERRKLERDLHDGAQQQLVALTVKARLAQALAERDPERANATLSQIQTDASDALENLRNLARGIYPPLLADKGLAAALEAQAKKAAVPMSLDAGDLGRLPQQVEATVYFCTLEALNNVAKYAHASSVTVQLNRDDSMLTFEVTDDGVGFDSTTSTYGTGLQGMADRLEAIGGTFGVLSAPGEGTRIKGRLPVDPAKDAGVRRP